MRVTASSSSAAHVVVVRSLVKVVKCVGGSMMSERHFNPTLIERMETVGKGNCWNVDSNRVVSYYAVKGVWHRILKNDLKMMKCFVLIVGTKYVGGQKPSDWCISRRRGRLMCIKADDITL